MEINRRGLLGLLLLLRRGDTRVRLRCRHRARAWKHAGVQAGETGPGSHRTAARDRHRVATGARGTGVTPNETALRTRSRSGGNAARSWIVPISLRVRVAPVLWGGGAGQEVLRVHLDLLRELLRPVQGRRGHGSAHASENHGHYRGWDAALQRCSQDVEFGLSLLETEALLGRTLLFLPSLLLLLPPLLLLRLREQPRSHGFFGALPTRRRGKLSQMLCRALLLLLMLLLLNLRGRRRGRWSLPDRWSRWRRRVRRSGSWRQRLAGAHGRRRWQATVGARHELARRATTSRDGGK